MTGTHIVGLGSLFSWQRLEALGMHACFFRKGLPQTTGGIPRRDTPSYLYLLKAAESSTARPPPPYTDRPSTRQWYGQSPRFVAPPGPTATTLTTLWEKSIITTTYEVTGDIQITHAGTFRSYPQFQHYWRFGFEMRLSLGIGF